MAREYANIRCSIWGDEDFRSLSGPAQLLYFTLLTQGGLSFCGVADYNPKRLAVLTDGSTPRDVERHADELEAGRYIVLDRNTDEVFIRSFVRHDGLLKRPMVAVAMAKNYQGIISLRLRRAFVWELNRLHTDPEFETCKAWVEQRVIELLDEPSQEAKPDPLAEGLTEGLTEGPLDPPPTTATASASTTTTSNPLPLASEIALRDDRPDITRVCDHLAQRLHDNGVKPRITVRWRESARLMLDRDDRPETEIHRLIDWATADSFWRSNVLSVPKLRDKYDQLRLQAETVTRPATRSTTDERVNGWLALAQTPTQPAIFGEIA